MKKEEVEKFVDEVGLPLYEELTRLDKMDNQQCVPIKWRKGFSISKKKWESLTKLLKKKNEEE